MDNRLFYLIYKSTEATKMSITKIQKLTNKAVEKNAKLNITGLLIRKENGFAQYLEGGKTTILMLYESILRDKRHHSIILLDKNYLAERKFSQWSMLLRHVTLDEMQKIETLKGKQPNLTNTTTKVTTENLEPIVDLIEIYKNHN